MPINVTVHGVGKHALGESLEEVKTHLGEAYDAQVWREFNWDSVVEQVEGTTLDLSRIEQLASGLAAASRLGFQPSASASARWMGALQDKLATLAEVCLAIVLVVLLIVPPLTFVVLLPTLALGMTPSLPRPLAESALLWLIGLAAVAMAASVAAGIIASLVLRSLSPLLVGLRRMILVVTRPVVLVGLLPFTPFLWEFLSLGGETLKAVRWLLVTGLLALVLGPLFGEPKAVLGNLFAACLVIAGACVTWIVGQLIRFALGPTLKVLLDIFRYLGEPAYRSHLQKEFDALATELPLDAQGNRSVVFYAHSLGTVITIDSLANSAAWHKSDSVVLVTFGSPLRRFFLRFFPGILLPPSISAIHSLISGRLAAFRWVNVYRPFDQIGASLRLQAAGAGRDASTGQWFRFKSAHTGYLNDPTVWRTHDELISTPVPELAETRESAALESYLIPDTVPTPSGIGLFITVLKYLSWVVLPITLLMMFLGFKAQRASAQDTTAIRSILQTSGVVVPCTVMHWETQEGGGEDTEYIDHFQFLFLPNDSGLTDKEIRIYQNAVFERYNAMFNAGALRDAVRDDCELQGKAALLQKDVRIPCKSRKIFDFRYLPSDPDQFDIPEHPPVKSPWRTALDWARLAFVAFGFCLVGGFMTARLGEAWARLLLGLPKGTT